MVSSSAAAGTISREAETRRAAPSVSRDFRNFDFMLFLPFFTAVPRYYRRAAEKEKDFFIPTGIRGRKSQLDGFAGTLPRKTSASLSLDPKVFRQKCRQPYSLWVFRLETENGSPSVTAMAVATDLHRASPQKRTIDSVALFYCKETGIVKGRRGVCINRWQSSSLASKIPCSAKLDAEHGTQRVRHPDPGGYDDAGGWGKSGGFCRCFLRCSSTASTTMIITAANPIPPSTKGSGEM